MKRFLATVLILLMAAGLCAVTAGAEGPLTLERVVRVSDSKFVLEFSEPVEVVEGYPFFALRIVNSSDVVVKLDDVYLQLFNNEGLGWDYYDDKHDRIVWIAPDAVLASDLLNMEGQYADERLTGCRAVFCIEELLSDGTDPEDGTIHNIRSVADGTRLTATRTNIDAYDNICAEVVTDYDYETPEIEAPSASQSKVEGENPAGGSGSESAAGPAQDSVFAENPAITAKPAERAGTGNLTLWLSVAALAVAVIDAAVLAFLLIKKK